MKKRFIYKRVSDCNLHALLFPVADPNKPLLIYLHGGGLIWGGPNDLIKEQIKLYNEAGYNVLSIAYRLAPETKIQAIAEDIRDALKWVRDEGKKEFNFDSERVAMIGSSAGGYLALLSGTFDIKPKAIISFYGYGDISGQWYIEPSAHFNTFPSVKKPFADMLIKKKEISEASALRRYAIYLYCRQEGEWLNYTVDMNERLTTQGLLEYCPTYLVNDSYPPTLLLHGNNDEEVPYEESLRMKAALDKNKVENQLITIRDGKHSFDKHMHDEQVKRAFDKVLKFLNKTI